MNQNQRGGGMGWVVFIGFIVLVVGSYFYLNREDNIIETTQNSPDNNVREEESTSGEVKLEEIDLVAVDPFTGSGTASRTVNAEVYEHKVFAQVDDPQPGKFYEGWLVNGSEFISTGALDKNENDVYVLEFTSSDDLSGYDKVVITEETEANGLDGNPEAHVLEGDF